MNKGHLGPNSIFIWMINLYQIVLSPFLGKRCRFYPSCSTYAKQCFEHFPLHLAFYLTLRRVVRCSPLSDGGYDPIPMQTETMKE
ncbi:MAG: membrane protein insertion efficiency factor YidD [Oligoflexia bacterium]|nr:membrane protein insertion efficiency factor YidD [Oligoflexia bacterium]